MATGRAELLAETFVSRVRMEGRRATGVDVIGPDGRPSQPVRAATWSSPPVPSRRRGCCSCRTSITDLVGRYLMTHFQTITAGSMPFRTYAERGRAVTHVHDDMIVGDDASRAAAAEAGLPWIRGGLVEHGGAGTSHHGGQAPPLG